MAKVLVLDDVLDAVNLMKRILETTGHDVVGFTEEEEALKFARTHFVDLAILDINLKKISGLEVLEELKKNNAFNARHYANRISDPGDGTSGPEAGCRRILRQADR